MYSHYIFKMGQNYDKGEEIGIANEYLKRYFISLVIRVLGTLRCQFLSIRLAQMKNKHEC